MSSSARFQRAYDGKEKTMNNKITEMLESAVSSIRTTIDANSVVGTPVSAPDGTLLIPITRVSFGFGGGGGDFEAKNVSSEGTFAGGLGGGASVKAEAFLVINDGNVRLITMDGGTSTVDRIMDLVPDALSKVNDFITKKKNKGEEDTTND
jgi:sporulation protein YtfJ